MIRLLVGLALLPTSCIALFMGARTLGSLAQRSQGAAPFFGGLGLSVACWLLARYGLSADRGPLSFGARLARRFYVIGHELTHAMTAWGMGGKVHGFQVGEDGGHVDLSESNFIIALAPYCVPFYTLFVIVAYRLLLWLRPDADHPRLFLGLMGVTLAFHLVHTFEGLWDSKQSDLQAAGGRVFSLSLIGLANGLVITVLLKALFPHSVDLGGSVAQTAAWSVRFWTLGWHKTSRFLAPLQARYPL